MKFLARLLGAGGEAEPIRAARWVVLDCETSGLDPARDRLLAVGAVAVRGGKIELAESFSAVLRQESASDAGNILVHGIGGEAQRNGRPADEALREFAVFLGDGLPVAFHAPFDEAVLRRAMSAVRGLVPPRRWLDLAQLGPALYPGGDRARRSLDDWLGEFGIACPERHDALGDAVATAQLLLVLLAEAERQRINTVGGLRQLARSAKWIAAG
jgi:DNA polymerase-3 subunit epsilon